MRVSGYIATGNKTALGTEPIVGRTAAISPNCIEWLGKNVYVKGHGRRYISDLTAEWIGTKFGICTIDLLVPNNDTAMGITGMTVVVRIDKDETNF